MIDCEVLIIDYNRVLNKTLTVLFSPVIIISVCVYCLFIAHYYCILFFITIVLYYYCSYSAIFCYFSCI